MELFIFQHIIWMYHCNKLHNNNKDYTAHQEELKAHIKLLYAHKDDLLAADRLLIQYCLKVAATSRKKQAGIYASIQQELYALRYLKNK
eukprot:14794535-Ditylum_brightwellii.AAC.1